MTPWKAILAALAIFIAGLFCGVTTDQLAARRVRKSAAPELVGPLGQRVAMMRRLAKRLELTPEQQRRIDTLIRESQQRLRELWDPIAPKAQEEMRHLHKNIELELTPEQRARFKALLNQPPHSNRMTGSPKVPGSSRHPPAEANTTGGLPPPEPAPAEPKNAPAP